MVDVARARAGLVPGRAPAPARETVTARQSPCPDSPLCTKQLELAGVRVPAGDVDPSAEVVIGVDLLNHALRISSFDPDNCARRGECSTGLGRTEGYCARIVADPEWTGAQETFTCSHRGLSPPNGKSVDLVLPAPGREGDLDVAVHVELPGSGERSQDIVEPISYREGGSTSPTTPGDDSGNGGSTLLRDVAIVLVLAALAFGAVGSAGD